jgi:hypothetical protein
MEMWTAAFAVLGGAIVLAAAVIVVGSYVRKRRSQKREWDSGMIKMEAAASAVLVFACSMVALWMPMFGVVFKPLGRWTHSDRPPVLAALIAASVLPSLIIAIGAYLLGTRFLAGTTAGDDENGQRARRTARKIVWFMVGVGAMLMVLPALWYRGVCWLS